MTDFYNIHATGAKLVLTIRFNWNERIKSSNTAIRNSYVGRENSTEPKFALATDFMFIKLSVFDNILYQ